MNFRSTLPAAAVVVAVAEVVAAVAEPATAAVAAASASAAAAASAAAGSWPPTAAGSRTRECPWRTFAGEHLRRPGSPWATGTAVAPLGKGMTALAATSAAAASR